MIPKINPLFALMTSTNRMLSLAFICSFVACLLLSLLTTTQAAVAITEDTEEPKLRKKVWLDADPTFGDHNGDCNDGFALIALLHATNIEVVGVSATFANTDSLNAYSKLKFFRDNYYPDLEISIGASEKILLNNHKKGAKPIPTEIPNGVYQIVEALKRLEKDETLTIVAVGALTNIAILLISHPRWMAKIDQIIIVAGRYNHAQKFQLGTTARTFRDLNYDVDPLAMDVILNAPVKTVLAGLEVWQSVWLHDTDLDRLKNEGSPAVKYMAESSAGWLQIWKSFGNELNNPSQTIHGFHPFDLLAAAFAINENWFAGDYRRVKTPVFHDDTQAAVNMYKQYLVAPALPIGQISENLDPLESNVALYLRTTTPEFKAAIMKILLRPDEKKEKIIKKLC